MCGIILNEVITNSLKYAFKEGRGTISVSLKKIDKEFSFIIEDDGVGFDINSKSSGFGHSLIKGLTESNLNGKFSVVSNAGTKVLITF